MKLADLAGCGNAYIDALVKTNPLATEVTGLMSKRLFGVGTLVLDGVRKIFITSAATGDIDKKTLIARLDKMFVTIFSSEDSWRYLVGIDAESEPESWQDLIRLAQKQMRRCPEVVDFDLFH